METITPIETIAHVDLVVTTNTGAVLFTMGGDNPALAKTLAHAHQLPGFPVKKMESLRPLGQDCYEVSREFVLAVRGTFLMSTWQEIVELDKALPGVATYTFVVTV